MLRPQGLPTTADCVTATPLTSATNRPSFVQIGQKLAEPDSSKQTHSAIATTKTTSRVRRPQYKNNMVPKNHFGTMLHPQGAPTAANCVTVTTTTAATNLPSFVQIGPKLAKPSHHNRCYYDTTLAIVTLPTSRGPQKTSYEESVPKTTIKEYQNL
jgi:hypothetical protein